MTPTAEQVSSVVAAEAAAELEAAVRKISHCLSQLTEAQVWWRPSESMNSIGNLILHLCGNLRQWIVAGIGGASDVRNRPLEFSERGPIAKDELERRLQEVVRDARRVLSDASPADLLQTREIQGFEVTGAGALFHSVPHFRGHTQEMIHLTRCQLGDAYVFDSVPKAARRPAE